MSKKKFFRELNRKRDNKKFIIKAVITLILIVALIVVGIGLSLKVNFDNKVEKTNYISLDFLSDSGNDEGRDLIGETDYKNVSEELDDYDRLKEVNITYQSLKYDVLNKYIKDNKIVNILDIYSGYNPRFVYYNGKNFNYYAYNNSEINSNLIKLRDKVIDEDELKDNIYFNELDLYNMDINEELKGNTVIIVDELLNYLDEESLKNVLINLKNIMAKYNAKLITTDLETKNILVEIGNALYNDGETLYNEQVESYKYSYKGTMQDLDYDKILDNVGLTYNKIILDKNYEALEKFTDVKKSNLALVVSRNYYYEITIK